MKKQIALVGALFLACANVRVHAAQQGRIRIDAVSGLNAHAVDAQAALLEIGRASCRERV